QFQEIRSVLRIDPKKAHIILAYVHVLLEEDRLREAETELHRAIKLNPSAGEPHRDLGEVFQRKGEFDRALVEFGRAAELMPNDRRSHYMRARVLGKLGKQDEATREMQL